MDENLTIGTPEAAVRSCVNVLARVFNCDEGRLAFYLDMYWQLRCTYEANKTRMPLGDFFPEEPHDEPEKLSPAKEPEEGKKACPAAAAAEEKRRIRTRLMDTRKDGVGVLDIVKISNGNIKEETIRDIIQSKPVPVAVYRILDAALDKLENK